VVGAEVVESCEERLESFEILQPADGLRGKSRFAVAGHGGTEDRVSIWRAGPIASPRHSHGAIPVPNTIGATGEIWHWPASRKGVYVKANLQRNLVTGYMLMALSHVQPK